MSGRHRKQSETGSVAGKAALSGLALTGAGMWYASAADAATDDQWDRVAACESGNNWHINTGNGYQGGLQFNSGTWLSHGGGQFASAANLATREQQIAIAEKVLASQGRGAWPVCGRGLGAATLRQAPGPKAPESIQPKDAPDAVAVADVEKDATSDYAAPAVAKSVTGQAHATQAGFSAINEALQIGQANDLRAPAPELDPADDVDAPEADAPEAAVADAPEADAPEAAVADAPEAEAPEAEPVADEQSDEAAPAEEATEADDLGEFVLAAKAQGFSVN